MRGLRHRPYRAVVIQPEGQRRRRVAKEGGSQRRHDVVSYLDTGRRPGRMRCDVGDRAVEIEIDSVVGIGLPDSFETRDRCSKHPYAYGYNEDGSNERGHRSYKYPTPSHSRNGARFSHRRNVERRERAYRCIGQPGQRRAHDDRIAERKTCRFINGSLRARDDRSRAAAPSALAGLRDSEAVSLLHTPGSAIEPICQRIRPLAASPMRRCTRKSVAS